jgi:osmoprotectant transport system substrate-binding protein
MSRRHPLRVLAAVAIVLATGVTSGCASTANLPGTGITLTIGAQNSLDNRVVASIYGTALAEQGYQVDYNWGIGNRTRILAGLRNGLIDLVPDYTGLLLSATDPDHASGPPDVAYSFLQSAVEKIGLTVLQPASAERAPVYVVTSRFASVHHITDLGDLAPIDSAITIGAADDLNAASYGRRALAYSYGVEGWTARAVPDDAAALVELRKGVVQVAVLSTVMPEVEAKDIVRLRDPRNIVLDQRIVPVLNSGRVDPTVQRTLDTISRQLTTDDLLAFSRSADALPERTAREWLESHELIEPAA